jgi:hypothetical protein
MQKFYACDTLCTPQLVLMLHFNCNAGTESSWVAEYTEQAMQLNMTQMLSYLH